MQPGKSEILTQKMVMYYAKHLREQEKSAATIHKYTKNVTSFLQWMANKELTKSVLLNWKEELAAHYTVSSINVALAALNGFFDFCGFSSLKIKPLKMQRNLFCNEDKKLERSEYIRLIQTAQKMNKHRLCLVIQTICATGIRVSELKFITVEAVQKGRAEINNKGKQRMILLPEKLRKVLKKYIQTEERTTGPVFVTKSGKALNRSNIWRDMKALCKNAKVAPEKVFPHNLRHLFARTYYKLEKNLSHLADILGHTNINTTRIYTMESGIVHIRQMGRMELVIT